MALGSKRWKTLLAMVGGMIHELVTNTLPACMIRIRNAVAWTLTVACKEWQGKETHEATKNRMKDA